MDNVEDLREQDQAGPDERPPTVHELHYVFDSSDSDDIVESFPVFLVSAGLAASIASCKLTGARLAVARGSLREPTDAEVPDYRWLQIVGHPERDDCWLTHDRRLAVTHAAMNALREHRLDHCDTPID